MKDYICVNHKRLYPIPGHTPYYVSRCGLVYSAHKSGRFLKQQKKNGYLFVALSAEEVIHQMLVHRLIAMTFLPNADKKRTVNHRNGNKADNRLANLEWATHKENMQHAVQTGLFRANSGKPARRKAKRILGWQSSPLAA